MINALEEAIELLTMPGLADDDSWDVCLTGTIAEQLSQQALTRTRFTCQEDSRRCSAMLKSTQDAIGSTLDVAIQFSCDIEAIDLVKEQVPKLILLNGVVTCWEPVMDIHVLFIGDAERGAITEKMRHCVSFRRNALKSRALMLYQSNLGN